MLKYLRTLRYLKPSQIAWRLRYALQRRLPVARSHSALSVPAEVDAGAMARIRSYVSELAWLLPSDQSNVQALCGNEFTFLNHTVRFDASVDWQVSNVSRLWRYHLHYFGWGRALALAFLRDDNEASRALFLRLVDDWIERNPRGSSPGWDAFVVSSRLMNWAQAISVFGNAPSHVLTSFALQTDWLRHHLEWDVRANHLLKNAQALAVADAVLGASRDADASQSALDLLGRELHEQILEDGGHYERSLMYHCQALEDTLLVHAALADPPEELTLAIERMAGLLARIVYPDGGIPQFGDASLELDTPPDTLLQFAKKRLPEADTTRPAGCRAEVSSGFYILEGAEDNARMTVKAGEPGPSYQLGHAHCDMLSYEFAVANKRLIVDSGVYGYENDGRRAHSRSTAAHNTVQVNRREQMECWDRFRVGRRYRPMVHRWCERADGHLLHASHDGFAPYRHSRVVYRSAEGFWLVADRIDGPDVCEIASFVHFHPSAVATKRGEVWVASADGVTIGIIPFGTDRTETVRGAQSPMQGWHFPSFGVERPATCLAQYRRGACPVLFGYGICMGSEAAVHPESLRSLAQELF